MNQKIDRYTEYVNLPCEYERLQWLYATISKQRKKGRVVRILEVGCGKGNVAIPLGLINFSEVKGIDVLEEQVRIGNERNSLRNVTISYEKLVDCAISKYDFIVLTRVMEDVDTYKDVLLYIEQNANPLVEIQLTITGSRLTNRSRNFFSVKRLKKEMLECGLEVFEVKKVYVFSSHHCEVVSTPSVTPVFQNRSFPGTMLTKFSGEQPLLPHPEEKKSPESSVALPKVFGWLKPVVDCLNLKISRLAFFLKKNRRSL